MITNYLQFIFLFDVVIHSNMEIVIDQGDAPRWSNPQRLTTCSTCADLGYVPDSEYAPWTLTFGEDEKGNEYISNP